MRRFFQALVLMVAAGISATAALAVPPASPFDRSNADGNQLLLRAAPAELERIAAQYGLAVGGVTPDAAGHLAVIEGPMTPQLVQELLAGDPGVESLEPVELAALAPAAGTTVAASDVAVDLIKSGDFPNSCPGAPAAAWSGYADQEAARLIAAGDGQLLSPDCGDAVVAVIDTGIDPGHPVFEDALVPGYDFLRDEAGAASEWNSLEQSVQVIVEQSVQVIVEQSVQVIVEGDGEIVVLGGAMAPIADPALAAEIQDLPLPPYFGHGTMVAGLVRLVAPGARIMPLRVFDGNGAGHLFDVVRAVYYAVDHGADVINMSFSLAEDSPELRRAIHYARERGVVCVAAAGNGGEHDHVFPATLSNTVGVAATDLDDGLAGFSNFGAQLVELGAPGTGVVSAYPGGLFGAGRGTSFSAPLVAGAVALIHSLHPDADVAARNGMVNALKQGSEPIPGLTSELGSGRLDVAATVAAAAD